MTDFLIQQDQTHTTAIRWQHEFSMPSQRMAIDYAQRLAKIEKRDMVLFAMDDVGDWDYIATIVVEVVARTKTSRD